MKRKSRFIDSFFKVAIFNLFLLAVLMLSGCQLSYSHRSSYSSQSNINGKKSSKRSSSKGQGTIQLKLGDLKETTTNANVYLRTNPGQNTNIIKTLKKGVFVYLTGKKYGNWRQVVVGKKTGWVNKTLLNSSSGRSTVNAPW